MRVHRQRWDRALRQSNLVPGIVEIAPSDRKVARYDLRRRGFCTCGGSRTAPRALIGWIEGSIPRILRRHDLVGMVPP
jgi:hypothetical protein